MNDILTHSAPATDAETLMAIDQMLTEINRKHEEMVRTQQEIEESQAHTVIIMQDIRTLMDTSKAARC